MSRVRIRNWSGNSVQRRDFLRLTTLAAAGSASRSLRATRMLAKARVVIAGGGFAGSACALELRRIDPSLDVVLIDPDERYVTCPMSNEVIVGLRELRSITLSRAGLTRAGVRWIADRVANVDHEHRRVRLAHGNVVEYDRLVVAPGIRFLWNSPQGYDEAAAQRMPHAWQAGAQTILLAGQLREMQNGGVVAISVPSGLMRCPPAPYERASLIAHYLRQHKPRAKVLIFDANNRFPRQDQFTDAWQEFYPGMIEWIPMTQDGSVVRVDVQKNTLYTAHGAHAVAVANIIPAQAPGQLALDTGLASGHGWCPIKSDSFESRLLENVHVIGDACIADAMPKSASTAHSQAQQCARAIAAALDGREPPAAVLDSVCYSTLAPGRELAIRGNFHVVNGEIRQIEAEGVANAGTPASASARVHEANDWYKSIVADSFGV
jgi:NADPH-dependent 2,4-dienoyl-CoA reductase/sulfur reductase-like enzyme